MKISPAKIRFCCENDIVSIIEILTIYNMHHIPSPEMPEFDMKRYVVAEIDSKVVGFAGFRHVDGEWRTTLSAVHPDYKNMGIGFALQQRRLDEMKKAGAKKVITFSDRPETIEWWIKYFGYKKVGSKPKLHDFGESSIKHWTKLEVTL